MKQFINPVDILDLAATELTAIDDTTIKRARKATLAEIDLSDDGMFDYKGHQLTRTDCERVIEALEDREQLEFYHFIANHPTLTDFLVKGDDAFLVNFRYESIYQLPAFVNFISPYFAEAYNQAIWKAWQRNDGTISRYTEPPVLVTSADLDDAYLTIRTALNNQINEVIDLKEHVRASEKTESLFESSTQKAEQLIDAARMNALPAYFQQLRNAMCEAIRQLSVEMAKQGFTIECTKRLNDAAQVLKADGVNREKLMKDAAHIRQLESEAAFNASTDPEITAYLELFRTFPQIIKAAENTATSIDGLHKWLHENVDIAALNAAGDKLAPVRKRLAMNIRDLGVTVWNHHSDSKTAVLFLELALHIEGLDEESIANIQLAKSQVENYQVATTAANEALEAAREKKKKNDELWNIISIMFGIAFAVFVMSARGCR